MNASGVIVPGPFRSKKATQAAMLAVGIAGAVAFGAVATLAPQAALLAAALVLVVPLAIWMPGVLVVGAFCLMAVSPLNAGLSDIVPEGALATQRFAALLLLLPYALHRGIRWRWLTPVAAYVLAGMASYGFGLPIADWSVGQAVRSLVSLATLWVVLSIDWDPEKDLWILKACALLPIASTLLATLLSPVGLLVPWGGGTGLPRLQGGMIASYIGGAAAISVAAALALRDRSAWRYAGAVAIANVVICLAAGTRGAILMLLVVLAVAAVPMIMNAMRSRAPSAVMRLVALMILVPALAFAGLAVNERRSQQTVYNTSTGQTTVDASSGRFTAWEQFYDLAQESIYFGRGLGAGPVAVIDQQGYKAQHNEYLRMVLEFGYVGGILVLVAMGWTLADRIRAGARNAQRGLGAAVVGFAVFSFTDNTLTVPQLAIPFALLIALGAATRRAPPEPTRRDRSAAARVGQLSA